MAHGNIYRPEKIDASLAHYFRTGNLIALRELALLWVADQVDVALQRYRTAEGVEEVWEARERVVVAVTGGPESATVLRRAARIARRSGSADLLCVHVLRGDGLATAWSAGPEMRRLAEDVEASFHTVVGDDVPATLLEFARTANATQLVLGTSRRSRWARLVDPGIGAATIAESGSIDVHLVSHAEAGEARQRPRLSLPARRHVWGWPAAVVLPVLATVLGVALRESVDLSTDVVLFFLATVVTAMIGGLAPALVAAIGGGLLLNVFLTPPLYTLSVAQPENAFAIGAMVVVALLVAAVVDRADRRATQAATARAEATLLASFARVVLSRSDPLPKLLERVREAFGLTTVALLERSAGTGWETTACTGGAPCARPADADADVEIDEGVHLVGTGRTLTSSERALFSAVSGQALLALRNRRMAAQATDAQRRADAAGLRTALLSAVGHDLRTPLTAIKAAAGSLRDPVLRMPAGDRQELLATVEESADRLTGLVDNLLDSSRLATGAVTTVTAPVGFDEVVAAALAGVLPATDRVVVEVAEDLPHVLADAGLAERVVANLVDNALRHGGGTTVAVRASAYADRVELRVVDTGPGVPRHQRDLLFTAVPAPRRPAGRDRSRPRPARRARLHRGDGRHARGRGHAGRWAHDRPVAAGGADAGPGPVSRVLVVDDDPHLLRTLRINLTAHGHTVVLAADGAAALRAAAEHPPPDVVILDLGLPDMPGLEVLAGLRGWSAVPVIVLSARTDSVDKVAALDAGADDYVTKPFGVARAARPPARRGPAGGGGRPRRDARGRDRQLHRRPRRQEGRARRRRGAPEPHRVGRPRAPRPPPRDARHPAADPARGVGPRLRHRGPLPAGVPRAPAPQARARPRAPAAPRHGGGAGVPLRAVSRPPAVARRSAASPTRTAVRLTSPRSTPTTAGAITAARAPTATTTVSASPDRSGAISAVHTASTAAPPMIPGANTTAAPSATRAEPAPAPRITSDPAIASRHAAATRTVPNRAHQPPVPSATRPTTPTRA